MLGSTKGLIEMIVRVSIYTPHRIAWEYRASNREFQCWIYLFNRDKPLEFRFLESNSNAASRLMGTLLSLLEDKK